MQEYLVNRLTLSLVILALVAVMPPPRLLAQDHAETPAVADQAPAGRAPLTFFEIVFSGGPLGIANMLVLIGLSTTALALAVDNLRLIQKSRLMPLGLSDEVRGAVASGDLARANELCAAQPSLLAAILIHGFAETSSGWAAIEKAMEESLAEQAAKLFRRIEYLRVIGHLAPLVGLLGTVTGMLLAFKQISDSEGSAGTAQLADGIYHALVTTVFGLVIAIPSLAAFALLRSRLDELVAEAAHAGLHAFAPLKQAGPASPSPPIVTPPPPPPAR
jgi:biopolymer transport protein ExbB